MLLRADITNALAEQNKVNTAVLRALHYLIEGRMEANGTKEEQ